MWRGVAARACVCVCLCVCVCVCVCAYPSHTSSPAAPPLPGRSDSPSSDQMSASGEINKVAPPAAARARSPQLFCLFPSLPLHLSLSALSPLPISPAGLVMPDCLPNQLHHQQLSVSRQHVSDRQLFLPLATDAQQRPRPSLQRPRPGKRCCAGRPLSGE